MNGFHANYIVPILSSLTLIGIVGPVSSAFAEECPVTQAAVISTAGNSNGLGSLSQAFVVPPGYETMTGRVRFLSNEWPTWYGSQYNDTYLATLTAPGKSLILASGNVNSSAWTSGTLGYNGKATERNFTADLSALVGKTVNLNYEVRDVGDLYVDSALAVDGMKVVRTQQYLPAGGGTLNSNDTISGTYGQVVKLTFKNLNVLGTTIQVSDKTPFGETQGRILLPLESVTFTFSRFGEEPMGWSFDISTNSDAFIVGYSIESTWVEGMPNNPCY